MGNSYRTSNNLRVTQAHIERKIRGAKAHILQKQIDEHGYNFCQECGKNGNYTFLDCYHNISVKECKELGKTELAWDEDNIKVRCMDCHNIKDKTNLQWLKEHQEKKLTDKLIKLTEKKYFK